MTNNIILGIVKYCSEEVGRQYYNKSAIETAEAIPWMVEAWLTAINNTTLSSTIILQYAKIIEPIKNVFGYRTTRVMVNNNFCPDPRELDDLMERYLENFCNMTVEEAYFEFEQIHPFIDGNGRIGKIIFNWKNNSLLNPIWPPNKWNNL